MRFKHWLAEQQQQGLMGPTATPTQDKKALDTAVQGATKMPEVGKLATNVTGNNPQQMQQGAIKVAQTYMKQNPLTGQTPNVTAPAVANGILQQVAGKNVPLIGAQAKGFQPNV